MTAFTYLSNSEAESYTKIADKDLAELVDEIKRKTGEQLYVAERIEEHKPLFKKPEIVKTYNLYAKSGYEYQCVNIGSTKGHLMTYFYGILTGLNYQLGFKQIIRCAYENQEINKNG